MKEQRRELPRGIKKTRQRECVLSVLENSDYPMSAVDICGSAQKEDCRLWLSTVYRILELFVKEDLALKTTMPDGGTALYELNRFRHRHYAVCLGCRRVLEMEGCPLEGFATELSERDFRVTGHRIEMYGYCKECDLKRQ